MTIPLGNDRHAIVDVDLHESLMKFAWRAVKYHRSYYARSIFNKHSPYILRSMHRLVARTPRYKICHHRNRNTLDNRRCNLVNMSREEHKLLHKNNSLLIKFEETADTEALVAEL